jgi:hypothetical protein
MVVRLDRTALLQEMASGRDVNVDGEQERAYLIVEIPCKIAAFLLLQAQ